MQAFAYNIAAATISLLVAVAIVLSSVETFPSKHYLVVFNVSES